VAGGACGIWHEWYFVTIGVVACVFVSQSGRFFGARRQRRRAGPRQGVCLARLARLPWPAGGHAVALGLSVSSGHPGRVVVVGGWAATATSRRRRVAVGNIIWQYDESGGRPDPEAPSGCGAWADRSGQLAGSHIAWIMFQPTPEAWPARRSIFGRRRVREARGATSRAEGPEVVCPGTGNSRGYIRRCRVSVAVGCRVVVPCLCCRKCRCCWPPIVSGNHQTDFATTPSIRFSACDDRRPTTNAHGVFEHHASTATIAVFCPATPS